MKRQRVIIALDYYPHFRRSIMTELVERGGHEYILAGGREDCWDGTIKAWEIPASFPFIHTPALNLGKRFRWMRGTVRLALRRDIDCIIYHSDPHLLNTWVSAIIARLMRKRVLFYSIGWFHHDSWARTLFKHVYYRLAHGLLLYGHYAKMIGIEQGHAPERLYVCYNSLAYDEQKSLRQSITEARLRVVRVDLFGEGGAKKPMVVCTSRLTPKRRLDLLVEALAILKRQGHEVNLLLVGDGAEREKLERMAREGGIESNVKFYGACYDERVLAELIAAANVSVAPGMVGLTAMHSLAYGTPVITHDSPLHQSPENEIIIPGRTGEFFRHEDAHDLARAVRAWTQTEFTLQKTREACYEFLERFYNSPFRRRVFDRAVGGAGADDVFWMKGGE
jgi:glycosyltransferase involved in cell wall biosynthesis